MDKGMHISLFNLFAELIMSKEISTWNTPNGRARHQNVYWLSNQLTANKTISQFDSLPAKKEKGNIHHLHETQEKDQLVSQNIQK